MSALAWIREKKIWFIGISSLVILLISIPLLQNYVQGRHREEIPRVVNSIRDHLLKTAPIHDGFSSADWAPRNIPELDSQTVSWNSPKDFGKIGWSPSLIGQNELRGAYRIKVSNDYSQFVVEGWADLDEDGVLMRWSANAEQEAQLFSAPEVH